MTIHIPAGISDIIYTGTTSIPLSSYDEYLNLVVNLQNMQVYVPYRPTISEFSDLEPSLNYNFNAKVEFDIVVD